MPMSSYPELHELIWFFETEPELKYEDIDWPVGEVVFTTRRDPWQIRCSIGAYEYSVEIDAFLHERQAFHLKLNQDVDIVSVERRQGSEALVIQPRPGHDLGRIRLQLKPHFSLSAETADPWTRR